MRAQHFQEKSMETPLHEVGDVKVEKSLTTSNMFLGLSLQLIGITKCTTTPVRVHEQVSLLVRSLKSNFFRRRSNRAT